MVRTAEGIGFPSALNAELEISTIPCAPKLMGTIIRYMEAIEITVLLSEKSDVRFFAKIASMTAEKIPHAMENTKAWRSPC